MNDYSFTSRNPLGTVLVTNCGGTLAQGLIRTWRRKKLAVRIVGVQFQSHSAADLICDEIYQLPESYSEAHGPDISFLSSLCTAEGVKFIIPTTDFETYELKKWQTLLPFVACSEQSFSLAAYDKYETSKMFRARNIPFVETYLPSIYRGELDETFVKPRKGGLSRDLHRNPTELSFSDDYVIQKLLEGREITVAFYVKKNGELHGFIAMERTLTGGMTSCCSVTNSFNKQVEEIVDAMVSSFPIIGPCNFQAKVLEDSSVVPFEVNSRFSGTVSIRANFGFSDACWLLQEYLYEQELPQMLLSPGSAVRMYVDLILPGIMPEQIAPGQSYFVS